MISKGKWRRRPIFTCEPIFTCGGMNFHIGTASCFGAIFAADHLRLHCSCLEELRILEKAEWKTPQFESWNLRIKLTAGTTIALTHACTNTSTQIVITGSKKMSWYGLYMYSAKLSTSNVCWQEQLVRLYTLTSMACMHFIHTYKVHTYINTYNVKTYWPNAVIHNNSEVDYNWPQTRSMTILLRTGFVLMVHRYCPSSSALTSWTWRFHSLSCGRMTLNLESSITRRSS